MSLKNDIYDLMQPILTGTVRFADENTARPALPYSVLKFMSVRAISQDHYSNVDINGVQTVRGDRELTLNIQHFGSDSVTFLQNFVDKLRFTTNIDRFMAKKITAFNTDGVKDISFLLDNTAIEKRATVDVSIRYKSTLFDTVGIIEGVSIAVDDDSSAINYTITVTL